MKVILTRDIPKVGRDGEIVTVADGYARNYLFPRQLALVANGAAMKQHQGRLDREAARSAALLATARENGEKLRDQSFQILAKASPKSSRLFGAITEADVVDMIHKQLGITIDKRKVSLIDPIKVTGTYSLIAKLHPEVSVPFSIDVVTAEQLEAREKERIAAEERAAKAAAAQAAAEAARQAAEEAAAARAAEAAANPQPTPTYSRQNRGLSREIHSALHDAPDAEG